MIRPHYVPLYQSISRSKKLRALPDHACRLFFTWLLAHLDSHGRVEADSATLNVLVWPMLGQTDEETERVLLALDAVGLVKLYNVGEARYLCDPAWERFAGKVGKPERRAESLIPAPVQDQSGKRRTTPDRTSPSSRARRLGSDRLGSSLGEEEGVQGEKPPTVEVEAWAKVFAEFPTLDVPEVRSAYRDLLAMRKRKRFGEWEPETLRKHLAHAVPFGPKALAEAFRESDRSEYRGVFPSKHAGNGAAKRANGEPTFGDLLDAARAKGASV